ncbi:MAG TPA: hypothetical protein DDW42_09365 [Desulfobacteraceae bacterium]|nr:hypothetical protein [Desulfobacteraceae bacterium]
MRKIKSMKNDTSPPSVMDSMEEKTIIGENISIMGDVQGEEDLLIEGSVKGKINLEKHHLTVGSKGQVEAEIQAENVTISGRLVGNINAMGKVEIMKEADFNGEIKAKRISVEDGAYLKAVIELERGPQKKTEPAIRLSDHTVSKPDKEPFSPAGETEKRK